MKEAIFRGLSGKLYRFKALGPRDEAPKAEGLYVFVRPARGGLGWKAVFLSRTANLEKRLAAHERWAEAQKFGASHAMILVETDRAARLEAEEDLLGALRPPMNETEDTQASADIVTLLTFEEREMLARLAAGL
jgi:hypothetical protein